MSSRNRSFRNIRRAVMDALEPRQLLTTFNPVDGPAFATALTNAQLGDTIILNAGSTYTGNFVMKNKTTGSGWITIQSSNLAALPDGVRVSPSDTAKMPKLVSAGSNLPAIRAEYAAAVGAHHFKLLGIEVVGPANNSDLVNLIELGTTDSVQNTLTMMPHDFVIDRCYIHSNFNTVTQDYDQHLRRGIALNSGATDITNCYISEIHDVGSGDSQAIGGSNGAGPYNIINNHLEAASENILFGGSGSYIPNTIPSDIVIRGNHFIKPVSWRGKWAQVKNLLELKVGARILIEQNLFENSWNAGQDGTAISFKLDQWNVNRPWQVTEDVTFRNNIVRHAAKGILIQGRDYTNGSPYGNVRRINVSNNLFDDINKTPWADWSGNTALIGGNFLYITQGPVDVTYDHNTVTAPRLVITVDTPTYLPTNFVFTNNMTAHGTYGIFSSDGGTGNNTITEYFNDGTTAEAQARMTKNVLMGGTSSKYSTRPGNFFPSAWTSVGFTDQNNGNFRLTNASAYHNAGTDGKDIGADFNLTAPDFAWMTGSVLNIAFNPSAPLPIALAINGSTVTATYDQSVMTFVNVASIAVAGTPGDDKLQLSGTSTLPITFNNGTGNDAVDVTSGSVAFTSDIGGAARNVAVTVAAGATANFNSSQHLRSLTVSGAANLSAGGNKVLVTKALTATGRLNLTNNDLVIDYTGTSPMGSWNGSAYTGVAGLLQSGRNGGDYAGNGIVTDQSNAISPRVLTTVGIAEASDVLDYGAGTTALFGTEPVDTTAIVIKYTWGGDANLDGILNGDDYFQIDSHFNQAGSVFGMFNGDFNLDGDINGDDYFILDSNFNAGSTSPAL